MNVYVASGLPNHERVRALQDELVRRGHQIAHDWASNHAVNPHETPEEQDLASTLEVMAVRNCDALLMVHPGGRGTHVELGMAIGARVGKIIVLNEDADQDIGFYRVRDAAGNPIVRLVRSVAEAMQLLETV